VPSWQSIRFRLSVQYSAVVFGLGGAVLGLVYLALQRELRSQTMTSVIVTGQRVVLSDGRVVIIPHLEEVEMRAIGSVECLRSTPSAMTSPWSGELLAVSSSASWWAAATDRITAG